MAELINKDRQVRISDSQMKALELLRATVAMERNYIWRYIAGRDLDISDDDRAILVEDDKKEENVKTTVETAKRLSDMHEEDYCPTTSELVSDAKVDENSYQARQMKIQINKATAFNAVRDTLLKYYPTNNYTQIELFDKLLDQYKKQLRFDKDGNANNLDNILKTIDENSSGDNK